ncbi:ABC transporter substrate-binding protein [Acuticoccus mangrovi]|uniref:ABC transporter substrate-binding protein n=1 Tax=Acuticoccus mangrovi TaxID=2796142 RepID=A0A934ISU2_9HYPH|nr:ABC transporter substrate-binding protein [Acuticoccus mangrovi]MBJ3777562.1 ABC transporter substrate-binding protein [Acuticoccus mangrovi]
MPFNRDLSRRRLLQGAAGATLVSSLGMPAVLRAQSGPIRIGHLTPLTGFLGPLGEYAQLGVKLAVSEINEAGGVNGRPIELVMEDSVNPQTASAKAERLLTRDDVVLIIGEISSSSGLAIGQVANRLNRIFINTGCNSDELRGAGCNPFMFHVEAANSMYVQTAGQYLLENGLVEGKSWYTLTADYAFGHDLLRVARNFLEKNGGTFAGEDLVATDTTDFSPFILKIRRARPDVVISNLSGNQVTNFIKQYAEFGLPFPISGFDIPTTAAWAAGPGAFSGIWPSVWHHRVDTEGSKAFITAFVEEYGKLPENQAWGDYNAMKIVAAAIGELGGADSPEIADYLRTGVEFDVLKHRPAFFRPYDNQLVQEMYAVRAKSAEQMEDATDVYEALGTVPLPDQSLEIIAPPRDGACQMPA